MYIIYVYIYIYIYIYIFKRYSNFIENDSATAFINSLLSTDNFSLMTHFKTNLQVIIYISYINEPDNNFTNYLKPSNGISNNYLIVFSK